MYAKVKGDKQDVYRVLTIFGSTTFFGTPIVTAVYGAVGTMYSNIFNIAYRVFLYSYAFVKMSGTKMDKDNFKKEYERNFLKSNYISHILRIIYLVIPRKISSNSCGQQM